MGLSAVTYALAKKYTDKTVIGLGGLKGAPCKVKSVVKTDGRSVVTLEWKADDGTTETSEVYINDGISIWIANRGYAINDIVIKDDALYTCKIANSDAIFDNNKWETIFNSQEYYIIDTISQRPSNLTSSDRRIYYCITDNVSYLWDGTKWSTVSSGAVIRELTKAQYDALSPAEKNNGTIYFVTDEDGGSREIQVATLPTPSADELDNIYQYIGTTTSAFQNGCFYKCVLDSTSGHYAWLGITVEATEAYEDDYIDFNHDW